MYCKSEFHTRIHEDLIVRKPSPNLNRQLYANGTSFLLNIFQKICSSNFIYRQCVYSL